MNDYAGAESPTANTLPEPFDHPHASKEAKAIAEAGAIRRAQVGSGVHGASITGQDDRDEMGMLGTSGLCNRDRAGAGDLDVVIYSARKWCRLALAGNPMALLLLLVPDSDVVVRAAVGAELLANSERFVSQQAGDRFLAYLRRQRAAMVAAHGYLEYWDTLR